MVNWNYNKKSDRQLTNKQKFWCKRNFIKFRLIGTTALFSLVNRKVLTQFESEIFKDIYSSINQILNNWDNSNKQIKINGEDSA